MANDDAEFVKSWMTRWDRGVKAKEEWEKDFEVGRCKDYWKGHQLDDPLDEFEDRRVQVNKVHPNVRVSLPSLYFDKPFVRVTASPSLADTPGPPASTSLEDKAQLLQDTANTLIRDRDVCFSESTHMALKESFWAFGCVRVMYDAEPVDNPRIPANPEKENENTPTKPAVTMRYGEFIGLNEDAALVRNERFYVKRIPARQVVCSADQSGVVSEIPWIGYWSIHLLDDVKRSKRYKNTGDLKASGIKTGEDMGDPKGSSSKAEKVKLINIFDQRTGTEIVLSDSHDKVLRRVKYNRLPLKFLRLDVDPDTFYPVPPIYHELHPQDEINDSREWLRLNRKGTVPRYTYDEDAIEPSEMKKLESGDMGTYIRRKPNTHAVIEPVPQPNYSVVAQQTYAMATQEFNELAITSGEQRGVPTSKTATQAKIMDVRTQIPESFDRITVASFLASVVEEIILMAIEKMTASRWIMINADPHSAGFPVEALNISKMYREITQEDLKEANENLKWTVEVEAGSMSPVAEEQERTEWLQALALLGNPIMARLMAVSPQIRKKTLSLYGMKSARDQEMVGQACMIIVQMEMQMAAMGGPRPPGVASQPGAPDGASTGAPAKPSPQPPNEDRLGGVRPPGPPAMVRGTV